MVKSRLHYVLESSHFFQPMKMNGKIEKLTIDIALIYENDNYCKPKTFTQIDNYCESKEV